MKLHKETPASVNDFNVAAHSQHLADKYMGSFNADSQIPLSSRRGGRYPPSRDVDFSIQKESDEVDAMIAKGGNKVPLTSEFWVSLGVGYLLGFGGFRPNSVH